MLLMIANAAGTPAALWNVFRSPGIDWSLELPGLAVRHGRWRHTRNPRMCTTVSGGLCARSQKISRYRELPRVGSTRSPKQERKPNSLQQFW